MILQGTEAERRVAYGGRKTGRPPAAVLPRRGGESGFTLIETMIAMFILVTALLGIISTTVIVIRSNTLSKTITTATTLADERMEILKNTRYDIVTNSLASGSDTVVSDSTYTRTWTVTDTLTPADNIKTITVSVAWTWQGVPHNVTQRSIIAMAME
ncbi:MAG: type IV pilus modification PilV family protein [Syntrophales bacterium]